MEETKPDNKNNKKIIAELHETFFKNDKRYDDYYIGDIIYEKGNHTVRATSTDDAYDESEKTSILNNILEEEIMLYVNGDKKIVKTKNDSDFLESYASMRNNMYGGLTIVKDAEKSDKLLKKLDDKHSNAPITNDAKLKVTKKITLS